MARQNVRYAGVTFSPSSHEFSLGIPFDVYFSGLTKGRLRVRAEFGVEIRWVFDIVRDLPDILSNRKRAEYTLAVAKEGIHDGVIAMGLGGGEVGNPPERYAKWFEKAREVGLHSVPHAGETVGPESVWGAIRVLGAERLGHGVRSVEDSELVEYLAERRIPLEICPISNIRLGIYPDLVDHPLRRLYDAGVPITINSDDPPLFNTTYNDEAKLLSDPFNFDINTINDILLNGVRHSFLPAEEKQSLETLFQEEMTKLRRELSLSLFFLLRISYVSWTQHSRICTFCFDLMGSRRFQRRIGNSPLSSIECSFWCVCSGSLHVNCPCIHMV